MQQHFEILLVEDNAADVRLTQGAFREGGLAHRLSVVGNGEEALRFLRREAAYSQAPRPNLILLDLNLPKRGGRELLAQVKQDSNLRQIPVVVLTTLGSAHDALAAYRLHANCFVTKPVETDDFLQKIKAIELFWLGTVRLPST